MFSSDLLKQFAEEQSAKLYNESKTYLDLLVEKRLMERAQAYLHTCNYQWFNPAIYDIPEIVSMINFGIPKDLLPRIVGYFVRKEYDRDITNYLTLDGQIFKMTRFGDWCNKLELFKQELKKFTMDSNNKPPMSKDEFNKLRIYTLFICKNCSDYLKQNTFDYKCLGDYCTGGIDIDESYTSGWNGLVGFQRFDTIFKISEHADIINISSLKEAYYNGTTRFKYFQKYDTPSYHMSELIGGKALIDTCEFKYTAVEVAMMYYMSELKQKTAEDLNQNTINIATETDIKNTLMIDKELEIERYKKETMNYLEIERAEINKQREKLVRQSKIVDKNTKKFQEEFARNKKIKNVNESCLELQNLIVEAELYLPETFTKRINKITKKLEDSVDTDDSDTETVISQITNKNPIVSAVQVSLK